ncbi:hypothetical protein BN59_03496 [Legionella massiliensis]|uniref:Ankyrin repeats (3 copies) n=1 Tax=Legionella massiliensis TaxID=1034943 RepID=A0A078L5H4_9GAMM|nr:hypothetical protein [Legionella massiliensis]CDZ79178.1 hypothetical protein BN59_03496 [Legionella massiliensis]CEE14916.1 hypothetical protein BN1094_03496 [Legionella massiliensis]
MALQTQNHQLLEFILIDGNININHQEVTTFSSAVHCCLDFAGMANCLSVLIKHGASVFGRDEQGLPIAHIILTNHPLLKQVFRAHRAKTIDSLAFYKKLLFSLKLYLAENTLIPEASYKEITEAIKRYQASIDALSYVLPPVNAS